MSPIYPDEEGNYGPYDINAKPPREEEPEFILFDDVQDECLDLYDAIMFGKRKERKHAARRLVMFAVSFAGTAADQAELNEALQAELNEVKTKNPNPTHCFGQFSTPRPSAWRVDTGVEKGPDPTHLYTEGAQPAASCVINEHAHGDDQRLDENFGWAHVDKDVDHKLKNETPNSGE